MATDMPIIEWKDLDDDRLNSAHRNGVDLCHAILELSAKGDKAMMMEMLDVLSAIIIYEVGGRQADQITSRHANNVMTITDRIDDQLSKSWTTPRKKA
jgi:hypothetical protein